MRIGFDWQARWSGSCGTRSIQHALLCLAIPASTSQIAAAAGTGPIRTALFGLDEGKVKGVLRAFGCVPRVLSSRSRMRARRWLDRNLRQGCPVIASTDAGRHWLTLCGRRGREYIAIDSADDDLVIRVPWTRLAERLLDENAEHYAIAVRPRRIVHRRWSIVPGFARHVRPFLGDEGLCRTWGAHLSALIGLAARRSIPGSLSMAAILGSRSGEILAGLPRGARIRGRRLLVRLQVVARAHRLGVRPTLVDHTVRRIMSLVAAAS